MFRRLDSSPRLSRFLRWISTTMAKKRGLPMLAGTALLIVSGLCFGMVMIGLVIADEMPTSLLWMCFPLALLYLGLFIGFLGFMLATPLGEAYSDRS